MIKHPAYADKSKKEPIGDGSGGTYVYVTSASSGVGWDSNRGLLQTLSRSACSHPLATGSWTEGGAPVTSSSSLLGKQLAGVYDKSVDNYVFYNDQLPNGSWTEVYGHSKGFFAYDSSSAFWVQHSIPKFPQFVAQGYEYGSGQMYYGQHAFCMTLTPDQLNTAAGVMTYAHPWVYDSAIANGASSLANVAAVVKGTAASGTTKAPPMVRQSRAAKRT